MVCTAGRRRPSRPATGGARPPRPGLSAERCSGLTRRLWLQEGWSPFSGHCPAPSARPSFVGCTRWAVGWVWVSPLAVVTELVDSEEPGGQSPVGDARPGGGRSGRAGLGLVLGALGVVYGDIGTSPLYSVQTVFAIDGGRVAPDARDVFGVVSLIFWSITLIVSIKYVVFVLRADNDGEGGVMALAALARRALGKAGGRRTSMVNRPGMSGDSDC